MRTNNWDLEIAIKNWNSRGWGMEDWSTWSPEITRGRSKSLTCVYCSTEALFKNASCAFMGQRLWPKRKTVSAVSVLYTCLSVQRTYKSTYVFWIFISPFMLHKSKFLSKPHAHFSSIHDDFLIWNWWQESLNPDWEKKLIIQSLNDSLLQNHYRVYGRFCENSSFTTAREKQKKKYSLNHQRSIF